MPVRAYAPNAGIDTGPVLALPPDEAAHVARVLRLGVGAALQVFDGLGREWHATVSQVSRAAVSVTLGAPVTSAVEPRVRYTVAVAVLKGDGTDRVVRDVTMMGASAILPVVSTRAETTVATLVRGRRPERWHRVAVASAKQCGRAVVPHVAAPEVWATLATAGTADLRLICVEPGAALSVRAVADFAAPAAVTVAVGPEGGWTEADLDLAVGAGWHPVQLGRRTLRATAAPLVALAACQGVWRDD